METILESTNRSRNKDIDKLHLYLKYLEVPQNLEFKYEVKEFDYSKIEVLKYNQEELHKYRIYIKKNLAKEKNSFPLNKKKVKLLSTIKDLLGTINDYNNGIKRLETYDIEATLFKKIDYFTQEQNAILFKEFIIINKKYLDFKSKENIQ